jgi:hypothetical protein
MLTKQSPAVLETQTSRRDLLKKAVYVTPAILTLAAIPAFAAKGSRDPRSRSKKGWRGERTGEMHL